MSFNLASWKSGRKQKKSNIKTALLKQISLQLRRGDVTIDPEFLFRSPYLIDDIKSPADHWDYIDRYFMPLDRSWLSFLEHKDSNFLRLSDESLLHSHPCGIHFSWIWSLVDNISLENLCSVLGLPLDPSLNTYIDDSRSIGPTHAQNTWHSPSRAMQRRAALDFIISHFMVSSDWTSNAFAPSPILLLSDTTDTKELGDETIMDRVDENKLPVEKKSNFSHEQIPKFIDQSALPMWLPSDPLAAFQIPDYIQPYTHNLPVSPFLYAGPDKLPLLSTSPGGAFYPMNDGEDSHTSSVIKDGEGIEENLGDLCSKDELKVKAESDKDDDGISSRRRMQKVKKEKELVDVVIKQEHTTMSIPDETPLHSTPSSTEDQLERDQDALVESMVASLLQEERSRVASFDASCIKTREAIIGVACRAAIPAGSTNTNSSYSNVGGGLIHGGNFSSGYAAVLHGLQPLTSPILSNTSSTVSTVTTHILQASITRMQSEFYLAVHEPSLLTSQIDELGLDFLESEMKEKVDSCTKLFGIAQQQVQKGGIVVDIHNFLSSSIGSASGTNSDNAPKTFRSGLGIVLDYEKKIRDEVQVKGESNTEAPIVNNTIRDGQVLTGAKQSQTRSEVTTITPTATATTITTNINNKHSKSKRVYTGDSKLTSQQKVSSSSPAHSTCHRDDKNTDNQHDFYPFPPLFPFSINPAVSCSLPPPPTYTVPTAPPISNLISFAKHQGLTSGHATVAHAMASNVPVDLSLISIEDEIEEIQRELAAAMIRTEVCVERLKARVEADVFEEEEFGRALRITKSREYFANARQCIVDTAHRQAEDSLEEILVGDEKSGRLLCVLDDGETLRAEWIEYAVVIAALRNRTIHSSVDSKHELVVPPSVLEAKFGACVEDDEDEDLDGRTDPTDQVEKRKNRLNWPLFAHLPLVGPFCHYCRRDRSKAQDVSLCFSKLCKRQHVLDPLSRGSFPKPRQNTLQLQSMTSSNGIASDTPTISHSASGGALANYPYSVHENQSDTQTSNNNTNSGRVASIIPPANSVTSSLTGLQESTHPSTSIPSDANSLSLLLSSQQTIQGNLLDQHIRLQEEEAQRRRQEEELRLQQVATSSATNNQLSPEELAAVLATCPQRPHATSKDLPESESTSASSCCSGEVDETFIAPSVLLISQQPLDSALQPVTSSPPGLSTSNPEAPMTTAPPPSSISSNAIGGGVSFSTSLTPAQLLSLIFGSNHSHPTPAEPKQYNTPLSSFMDCLRLSIFLKTSYATQRAISSDFIYPFPPVPPIETSCVNSNFSSFPPSLPPVMTPFDRPACVYSPPAALSEIPPLNSAVEMMTNCFASPKSACGCHQGTGIHSCGAPSLTNIDQKSSKPPPTPSSLSNNNMNSNTFTNIPAGAAAVSVPSSHALPSSCTGEITASNADMLNTSCCTLPECNRFSPPSVDAMENNLRTCWRVFCSECLAHAFPSPYPSNIGALATADPRKWLCPRCNQFCNCDRCLRILFLKRLGGYIRLVFNDSGALCVPLRVRLGHPIPWNSFATSAAALKLSVVAQSYRRAAASVHSVVDASLTEVTGSQAEDHSSSKVNNKKRANILSDPTSSSANNASRSRNRNGNTNRSLSVNATGTTPGSSNSALAVYAASSKIVTGEGGSGFRRNRTSASGAAVHAASNLGEMGDTGRRVRGATLWGMQQQQSSQQQHSTQSGAGGANHLSTSTNSASSGNLNALQSSTTAVIPVTQRTRRLAAQQQAQAAAAAAVSNEDIAVPPPSKRARQPRSSVNANNTAWNSASYLAGNNTLAAKVKKLSLERLKILSQHCRTLVLSVDCAAVSDVRNVIIKRLIRHIREFLMKPVIAREEQKLRVAQSTISAFDTLIASSKNDALRKHLTGKSAEITELSQVTKVSAASDMVSVLLAADVEGKKLPAPEIATIQPSHPAHRAIVRFGQSVAHKRRALTAASHFYNSSARGSMTFSSTNQTSTNASPSVIGTPAKDSLSWIDLASSCALSVQSSPLLNPSSRQLEMAFQSSNNSSSNSVPPGPGGRLLSNSALMNSSGSTANSGQALISSRNAPPAHASSMHYQQMQQQQSGVVRNSNSSTVNGPASRASPSAPNTPLTINSSTTGMFASMATSSHQHPSSANSAFMFYQPPFYSNPVVMVPSQQGGGGANDTVHSYGGQQFPIQWSWPAQSHQQQQQQQHLYHLQHQSKNMNPNSAASTGNMSK